MHAYSNVKQLAGAAADLSTIAGRLEHWTDENLEYLLGAVPLRGL